MGMSEPWTQPPEVAASRGADDLPPSFRRFPDALRVLMRQRNLSYRQMAYKTHLSAGYLNHLTKGTRPVPADNVVRIIAAALRVGPEHFVEYRYRQVLEVIEGSSALVDTLYGLLLLRAPLSDEMRAVLEQASQD
jgi:transcriptional regulator with XRE-family HTH domain